MASDFFENSDASTYLLLLIDIFFTQVEIFWRNHRLAHHQVQFLKKETKNGSWSFGNFLE